MELKKYLEGRKEKCDARIKEIDARADELKEKNETAKDEVELKAIADELAELESEKAELVAELKEVEAQMDALKGKEKLPPKEEPKPEGNPERKSFLTFPIEERGQNQMTKEELELRKKNAEAFQRSGKETIKNAEMRATLVSGGKIATPTEVHGIEDTFNRVSSIVDLVRVVNCEGMGSNKVAYEVAIGTASNQTEGQAISVSDPQYDFVTIAPESIGILSYISKQVRRQSPLDYQGKIEDSALKALKVKVASYITGKIVASTLLSKPANLKVTAIDDKTLRRIALSYGSAEAVYGNAWLFLTKEDLIAFGDVRGTNGNKSAVYEITPDTDNPNTGVIKDGGLSVRYCLNPNLTPLATASEDDVVMFYGQAECCELDLFSDYEIAVSEDYKFAENMLAIRGDAEMGADIIKKDGFVALTKGA